MPHPPIPSRLPRVPQSTSLTLAHFPLALSSWRRRFFNELGAFHRFFHRDIQVIPIIPTIPERRVLPAFESRGGRVMRRNECNATASRVDRRVWPSVCVILALGAT